MQKYITLFCVFLVAINLNCTSQDQVFTEELKENIKSRIENEIITGIVIGVITPEGTSFYSYGVKSLETKEPVDENTVFEIGSITKTFTGVLLANEVVSGELSLDDPLQSLLPEGITAPTRNGQSINLVHLANHSSALPPIPNNLTPGNSSNRYGNYTKKQLYDMLNSYELTRDIGSEFEYSNLGMGLLGTVIADKNNTNYEDLMLKNIAKPLGMENTRINLTPDMEKEFAKGHSNGVEVETWKWDIPTLVGCGAIRSTAVDMLKYLAANMGIEKSELYPAMKLAHKYSGSGVGDMILGLGWITQTVEGIDIVWHDGGTNGQMSFAGFTKDGKKGVVVLTNSTGFPDDIGFHLLNPKSELANPKPSIGVKLDKVIKKEGIESAIKTYVDLKKNHPDEYDFAMQELNKLGYQYLFNNQIKEALGIFKINMEAFPDDWNVYDSYGEALLENNEKEKAIEYYKKSIELNPENTAGIAILKKLGVEIESVEK
ncbi:serine hydrolase [Bacteroidota bacterium]